MTSLWSFFPLTYRFMVAANAREGWFPMFPMNMKGWAKVVDGNLQTWEPAPTCFMCPARSVTSAAIGCLDPVPRLRCERHRNTCETCRYEFL